MECLEHHLLSIQYASPRRSHSPFEALLAVSGNLDGTQTTECSGRARALPRPKREYSSADLSELDSADNTVLGGAYAEGVGTSGDTESQSESSRDIQVCKPDCYRIDDPL